ncbi:MAG: hypothetical protein GY746_01065 [Gammaproteobacteria bacterium]|nr:hypothetical protein [Gammaproteobacteria bacterium]MCP4275088.1 hypothetical protein [Gammaproteobacteria bacterium]MCP4830963.1 hypothetical protein [Gammaproteobacteria bacterium]
MQARLLSCFTILLLLTVLPVVAGFETAVLKRPGDEGAIEVRVQGLSSSEGILFVSLST